MKKWLYRLRLFWCRNTGGHRTTEVRMGDRRIGTESIHAWCERCGLHGEINIRWEQV